MITTSQRLRATTIAEVSPLPPLVPLPAPRVVADVVAEDAIKVLSQDIANKNKALFLPEHPKGIVDSIEIDRIFWGYGLITITIKEA